MPIVFNDPEPKYGQSNTDAFFTALLQGLDRNLTAGINRGYDEGIEEKRYQRDRAARQEDINRDIEARKEYETWRSGTPEGQANLAAMQGQNALNEQRRKIYEAEETRKQAMFPGQQNAQSLANEALFYEIEGRKLQGELDKLELAQAKGIFDTQSAAQQSELETKIEQNNALKANLARKENDRKLYGDVRSLQAQNPWLFGALERYGEKGINPRWDTNGKINAVLSQYRNIRSQLSPEMAGILDEEFTQFLDRKFTEDTRTREAQERVRMQEEEDQWKKEAFSYASGERLISDFEPFGEAGKSLAKLYNSQLRMLEKDAPNMSRKDFIKRQAELHDSYVKQAAQLQEAIFRASQPRFGSSLGQNNFGMPPNYGNGGWGSPGAMLPDGQAGDNLEQRVNNAFSILSRGGS